MSDRWITIELTEQQLSFWLCLHTFISHSRSWWYEFCYSECMNRDARLESDVEQLNFVSPMSWRSAVRVCPPLFLSFAFWMVLSTSPNLPFFPGSANVQGLSLLIKSRQKSDISRDTKRNYIDAITKVLRLATPCGNTIVSLPYHDNAELRSPGSGLPQRCFCAYLFRLNQYGRWNHRLECEPLWFAPDIDTIALFISQCWGFRYSLSIPLLVMTKDPIPGA